MGCQIAPRCGLNGIGKPLQFYIVRNGAEPQALLYLSVETLN